MTLEQLQLGTLWLSTLGMGVGCLTLSGSPGSVFDDLRSKMPSVHDSTTRTYVAFGGFVTTTIVYTLTSHWIFSRSEKRASKALLASLAVLLCEMLWEPTLFTSSERLLILLPLSISAALSWAVNPREPEGSYMGHVQEKVASQGWDHSASSE